MRILYLTHRLPYAPNRGDRVRAYHWLHHLAARHQVDLVSLVHHDDEEARAELLRSVADSVTTARVRRLRTVARGAWALMSGAPLTHALLHAPDLRSKVARVVGRARPDVVLAYCSGMARFALEPPLQGIPFLLDMVDVDSEKWRLLGARGRTPKHWAYRREASLLSAFEATAAGAAANTLVVNEREADTVREICGRVPVAVIPNGVDVNFFRPPQGPVTEANVVFCGVMNYEPNEAAALWLIREVWPDLRRARPDARLSLVGADPTRTLLNAARGDESIVVTGSVPDVRPYLWRAAISLAPLAVARGMQNKVLEAAAAGLPSIVTSTVAAGLPPAVMPACTVADTREAFVEQALGLLSLAPDQRRALASAARLVDLDWPSALAPVDAILARAIAPAAESAA